MMQQLNYIKHMCLLDLAPLLIRFNPARTELLDHAAHLIFMHGLLLGSHVLAPHRKLQSQTQQFTAINVNLRVGMFQAIPRQG